MAAAAAVEAMEAAAAAAEVDTAAAMATLTGTKAKAQDMALRVTQITPIIMGMALV